MNLLYQFVLAKDSRLTPRHSSDSELNDPALALLEAEPQERFIDLLALMVKRGLVDSIERWNRQRDLRNDAGHVYLSTAKDFADYYTALLAAAPGVAAYADRLEAYVQETPIELSA